ncbi:AMP-binding protein [Rhodococcus opacus]|uniref:Putative fatty-acid--CoA ligase n=1 Tax=Rhodococcus opacus (strain B4) TaxID=632772 RepID=C1B3J8_RHOOB|nr:AMP-binding protein [Rhodococcus opacus]BAH50696.1 putative fatty-acid--CoA ligase [Rhodococcus opacus B4]
MSYPGTFAESQPDRPAMVMAGSGVRISYRELDQRSRSLAKVFRSRGLEAGDTVAVVSEYRVEWAEVIWATARAGFDIAPVNRHLGGDELSTVLGACDARVVVASQGCMDAVQAAISGLPRIGTVLVIGGESDATNGSGNFVNYEEALSSVGTDTELMNEQLGGRVMFSAGTTGIPKAIRHPAPAVHPADAPLHLGKYTELFDFDIDTVYLSPAPLYHTAPFRFVLAITQLGGTVVCMERFDPVQALQAISEYRVTHAQFVPTMLVRMDRLPEAVKSSADLSSLKVAITGAAPCPPELKRRIMSWWGPVLHELYGASESYGNCHIGPAECLARPGSVGRALVGTIHITDDEGNERPVGQDGVVWFEGTSKFAYTDAGEGRCDNGEQWPGERGWQTVGDIGYLDSDGYLYLTGRRNQLIISGGVNIYPQEIEDLLLLHPAVSDVAVVGLPHSEYGEVVAAYVVPREQLLNEVQVESILTAYCRSKLAGYKCPRRFVVVDNLPRGDNGKLYKRFIETSLQN